MERIEWDDTYLLGVAVIDEQHKRLVQLINSFDDIVTAGEAVYKNKRDTVIKEIIDYTLYHFSEEETLFDSFNYQTADFHKSQHKAFINEVSRYSDKLQDSTVIEGAKFYSYLLTWLFSHIGKSDKAWATFQSMLKADSI